MAEITGPPGRVRQAVGRLSSTVASWGMRWSAMPGLADQLALAVQREVIASIGVKHPATPDQMAANTSWVFAANRQIAGRGARVKPEIELVQRMRGGPVAKSPVHDHPFLDLLGQPNLDEVGMVFAWRQMLMLNTVGRIYVLVEPEAVDLSQWGIKARATRITSMRLLEPERVQPVADQTRWGAAFMYSPPKHGVGAEERVVYAGPPVTRAQRELWRRNPYPFVFRIVMPAVDSYDGQSVTEAARDSIRIMQGLNTLHHNQLNNGLHAGLIFYLMKDIDNLERFMEAVVMVKAGIGKAGEPLVLPKNKVEVAQNPQSMSDMQFPELNQNARQEALAVLGASEGVVGLSGNVNRSVIEGLERIMALGTIDPMLGLIAAAYNQTLLPLYPGQSDTAWFEVSYPSSAATDEVTQSTLLSTMVKAGIYTPNDAREEMGKKPHEDGDILVGVTAPPTPEGMDPNAMGGDPNDPFANMFAGLDLSGAAADEEADGAPGPQGKQKALAEGDTKQLSAGAGAPGVPRPKSNTASPAGGKGPKGPPRARRYPGL